jgi:hypothetical protein
VDTTPEVRRAPVLAARPGTWVRDEEAMLAKAVGPHCRIGPLCIKASMARTGTDL